MMEQNTLQTMLQCYSGLKIIIGKELCIKLKFWPGGGGGKRRGLGPRNDVLTTCKAVTQRGGQWIITVFFPQ